MKKGQMKGQVTFFAVVGLMLVLFVLLYIASSFFLPAAIQKQVISSSSHQSLVSFIDSCISQTSKLALFFFGFVGGDVQPPAYPSFFSYDERYKIPYLYQQGKFIVLTSEFAQDVLEKYVDAHLQKCTRGFTSFPQFSITEELPRTKVSILDDEVVFSVFYPVFVVEDKAKLLLDPNYSARIPVVMKEMLQIANHIVELGRSDPLLIHWDYLTDVSSKAYNITTYAERDKTMVYRIVDIEHEVIGEPYILQFAVKAE